MKIKAIAAVCAATVVLALAPRVAHAQGTTSGSSLTGGSSSNLLGNSTTGGGSGGSASASGAAGQTVSAAVGSGLVTNVATVAASAGTPTATSIPSNANYLGSSYVNYFTLGLPQNYQGKFGAQNIAPNIIGTFGQYIYVPSATTTGGAASTTPTQGIGFTTFGQPRAPVYTTSFAETFPIARPQLSQVQADASDAIVRSSMLKNKDSIQVSMKGAIVMLTGSVGSETERATAEGMVRMTPGVGEVQNNLVVDPSKK